MGECVRGEGGQPGNLNAVKKPKDLTLDNLKLDSPEEILAFQRQVIRWLACGELGSRQAGAINHGLETMLKYHLDSKKLKEYDEYFQRVKALLDAEDAKRKASNTPGVPAQPVAVPDSNRQEAKQT